ncbi:hypothetical protein [Halosimplex pelagicum]|uniref:ApeA N-terminal domain-containing protein n=1 Tax=Halosimplex pelagicum TaxID=869886 RepID=A0A7D5P926_9EURY|nr:hypothetical protein [Halosimplex pelagicum]QLH83826.1 hypothetical protein HZS54_20290 [Halosimplex pelagicum]
MHDQRELRGHWWLPGNKENRTVGGVLSYHTAEGLELDVFDSLGESESDAFGISEEEEPQVVDRIFGITDDGDRVTLDECHQTFEKVTYGSEVTRPETFAVSTALIGEHFHEDIRLESVGMEVEAFHRWFSRSGLNIDFNPGPDGRENNRETERTDSGSIVRADYTYPDSETVVSNEFRVYLDPGITVQQEQSSSVKFSETTSIEVGPRLDEEPISLSQGKSVLRKIRFFIALGLQEPIQPIEITGYYESEGEQPEASVEILTHSSADAAISDQPHRQELLFLLPDIEDVFESLLDTWIQSFDELAPVLHIYFKTIYDDTDLMTTYLLRRATLEVYYRTQIRENQTSGSSLAHTDFEEPQASYDTIKALIGEGSEKSFDAQLEEILDQHSDTVTKASDRLTDRISDSQSSIESLFEGTQNSSSALHLRSESLGVICNIVILSEIGLSPDRIATFIETRS